MTFADLMAMKRVSDPQVSPSGKWVMFSVTDVDLEKNSKTNHLWVVPLSPTAGPSTAAGKPASAQDDNSRGAQGQERQMTMGATNETGGRFSPDGKWVLYTSDVGGSSQIWLAPWDEAKGALGSPRSPLTAVSTEADGGVWSPDSKRVMFVSSVWPECSVKGDSADPTHRGETAMNGAPGPLVVSGTRSVAAWAGAEAASWAEEEACDKAKDKAVAKDPVKGQVWDGLLYRHWDHWTGAKRSHVLVVDVSDGQHLGANVRDLTPASAVGDAETPTFSLGGPLGYAWAPDSKEIAYVTNLDAVPAASTNNDVFTLRLDEAGAKAVKVSTSPGSDDGPAYSPDGKWLAFRSQARAGFESDKFRLVAFDRKTKMIRDAVPAWDGWIDEFAWGQSNPFIVFASGIEGQERLYMTGIGGEPVLLRGDAEYSSPQVREIPWSGALVLAEKMRVNMPAELVVISTSDVDNIAISNGKPVADRFGVSAINHDRERQITAMNAQALSQLTLAPLESFWFEGAEGTKVEGFLIKPPGFDPAKKYPVKFLMHGGPQTAWGDAWSYRWNWELMAANGYVVVGINRRGSTGYGQKFVDEVSGDWGGRAYEDLMKGLDYAEAKYPFMDKTRECALGASYGGFMANWVLTHTNRFQCIVTHDGLYDPAAAYGNTEEVWFNEWEFRRPEDFPRGWDGFMTKTNTEILTGGQNDGQGGMGRPAQPWRYAGLAAEQDPFRKWSPMLHIQDAKTPTLVIHSQRDYRLDVSQGMELFTALQRLGVPSKMLYFPDEGHWVLKPQNSQLWNEVVGDWCDRWTKTGKYAVGQGTGNRQ
jgi:dipeptidyl aminopeptidase/acylaminoacyl peptidase